jgi:phosphatidylserine/phosphatidylglycerophosphate/cardiolipin synthase-like enzyme
MSVNGTPEVVACSNPDPRSEKLNSETALVFLEPVLAQRLRNELLLYDLKYSREVSPEQAAEYESPEDVIERFRMSPGGQFEQEL